MKYTFTFALAFGLLASTMIAQVQQNQQPQQQQIQPCQPAPKTPDIVNRQVAKQSSKWGAKFAAVLARSTKGIVQPIDLPPVKPPQPNPCVVQPQTPNPPEPAASAPAK